MIRGQNTHRIRVHGCDLWANRLRLLKLADYRVHASHWLDSDFTQGVDLVRLY